MKSKWLLIILILLLAVVILQLNILFGSNKSETDQRAAKKELPYQIQTWPASQDSTKTNVPPMSNNHISNNLQAMRILNDPFNDDDFFSNSMTRSMQQMQTMMNSMMGSSMSSMGTLGMSGLINSSSDFELVDQGDMYLGILNMPGVDKDKFNVKLKAGELIISGEREAQTQKSNSSGTYTSTHSLSAFSKTVSLPEDANSSGLQVDVQPDKVLIHIPKNI